MRAFEVYLNGRKLCTAGLPESGVVSSVLTWVAGSDPKEPEDMWLQVGGLLSRSHTHVDWAHRLLKEGDTVRIVVTQKARVSKPKKRRTETEAARRRQKLSYLKRLGKELGYVVQKKKRP